MLSSAVRTDTSRLAGLGIVVIGRNEEARLGNCLARLPAGVPSVYVDSGSRDRSVAIAREHGVAVHELDPGRPFCAARARNEGFDRLMAGHPDLGAVFFIDGDCELVGGFLEDAAQTIATHGNCAVVVGSVEETNAQSNVYGLLAALEWSNPGAGQITDFGQLGGIMMVRVEDFRAVGGFDPTFIAGEDSEFGIRLHLGGRQTLRIGTVMVRHAMDMTRFGQWWRRSVRAGHALAHRFDRHGRSALADSRSAVRSTMAYGLFLPILALVCVVLFGPWGLVPLLGYGVAGSRFFGYYRGKGAGSRAAFTGAVFGVLAKLANAQGLLRYHLQRLRGDFRLIEYK